MTTFTQDPWNAAYEAIPADADDARLGAGKIRDLKRDIRERLAVDHYTAGDANDGAHKKLTLIEQAGDPGTVSNTGFLYTKDVSTITELFWKDSTGASIQLTKAGVIIGTAVNIVNTPAANVTAVNVQAAIDFIASIGAQTGDLKSVAYASTPSGWLYCDGSAVSRTGQSVLYAKIGTIWGAGDGINTFNLPDYRGRALIGDGTGTSLSTRTVGQQTIGEESHILTVAELAAHSHTINDPTHTHGYNATNSTGASIASGVNTGRSEFASTSAAASTGITINNSGSDNAHNNMQPSAVVRILIKT
jgi:microcystin-dependent protein